jgi:hypothetical protein
MANEEWWEFKPDEIDWEDTKLYPFPDDKPLPLDKDGSLRMRDMQATFLATLGRKWRMHPQYEGHSLDCYLTAVFRSIYSVDDCTLRIVLDDLLAQRRRCKPTPIYLMRLCEASYACERRLGELNMAPYPPVEPRLPKPPRRRSRRVRLND